MTFSRQHLDAWLGSVARSALAFGMLAILQLGPWARAHKPSRTEPVSAASSQDSGTAAAGSPEEERSDAGP